MTQKAREHVKTKVSYLILQAASQSEVIAF